MHWIAISLVSSMFHGWAPFWRSRSRSKSSASPSLLESEESSCPKASTRGRFFFARATHLARTFFRMLFSSLLELELTFFVVLPSSNSTVIYFAATQFRNRSHSV
eukprot:Gregarina_sp_Poly_1__109@NODE_1023_length_5325_cov_19_407950_g713_i0_p5_GENE_NODE_1023_length_5325_cov_19_407950_g713_i0NODE_1023_length_5325_cov_19_407950_g713_i0_p5_ORF_typecomplete_len105_score2_84FATC/PF02260_20/0_11FATC/PF02260_20/8e03_NODE_1023_length_5325_cov_19_407950_g713_i029103224